MKTAITFKGWTVRQGALHVLKQCKPEWLRYAANPERAECFGFAALHDKCDANELLPFADDDSIWDYDNGGTTQDWTDYANAVMSEVNRIFKENSVREICLLILDGNKPQAKE